MKTTLLFCAIFLLNSISKSQTFSENFNTATVNSLEQNCWIVNGVSTTDVPGESITARSIYTAPPTNSNAKTDVYTPVLTISVTNPTISFDYRLTQTLSANASRTIQVGLVTTSGILILPHTITMGPQTGTGVLHYSNTFTIVPGDYRIVFRISGNNGSGNVRLVIDNFQATGSVVNVPANGTCNFVPIVEATLPVQLASFNATLQNKKVNIFWTTVTEINTSHFVVERSTDGRDYVDVALIFANGNTNESKNYSINDNISELQSPVIYYRLRSVDIDGKVQLSAVRVIYNAKSNDKTITLITFPNPATSEVKVTIPGTWQNKAVIYEIFDFNGRLLSRKLTTGSSQTEQINISTLSRGMYKLRVTCSNESAQQSFVKQ